MITTVGDLTPLIRTLVDDDSIDFATDAYLLPKIRIAYGMLITSMLENPNIGDVKSVIEIGNVPLGTVSFNAAGLFAPTGPLYLLKEPLVVEEKQAGAGREFYIELERVNRIVHGAIGSLNRMYSWVSQDVLLPGANQALDFRIFGTFEPQPLTSVESVLVPGTATYVQFRTAQLVAQIRGNAVLAMQYRADANDAEDSHFNHLIMAQQSISTRQRSFSGRDYDLRVL